MSDAYEFPRPLSRREQEILSLMLDIDDPRLLPLRDQARTASVVGRSSDGCATVDLVVDRSHAKAASLCSPVTEARVKGDPMDPETYFELILFLDDGWLSSLEIVHYGVHVPTEFPPPGTFEPPVLRC